MNGVGNQSTSLANPSDATQWYAPTTLKDQVKNVDYVGGMGMTSQQMNQMQYANANTNAFKEVTLESRDPTMSNVKFAPSVHSMGSIEFKNQINVDRYNPPRQTNFNNSRPDINMVQKSTPYYGDNINQHQITTLQTNPYYSNGPAQIYHYVNTPGYSQIINHQ